MNILDVRQSWVAGLGAAFTLLLATPAAVAFGGAGNMGECATFTTCTAGVYSSANSGTTYNVTATPSFPLGPLVSGVPKTFGGSDFQDTTQPAGLSSSPCPIACASDIPWPSRANARSQSDFQVNRARAETGIGASGMDNRGAQTIAGVSIQTYAEAGSSWHDVWTFSGAGQFKSVIEIDGRSSTETENASWPLSFDYSLASSSGEWFYQLRVWDTKNLGEDSDGFPGPALVTEVRSSVANEQRLSFDFASPLEFDYEAGVDYVVIAELIVKAGNGREIDLYNTARVSDVVLSPGTTLSALSGYDYVSAPVPEPQPAALWAFGLALLGWAARRQRRPHAD